MTNSKMKTRKRKMSQIVKTTLKKRKSAINSMDNIKKKKGYQQHEEHKKRKNRTGNMNNTRK